MEDLDESQTTISETNTDINNFPEFSKYKALKNSCFFCLGKVPVATPQNLREIAKKGTSQDCILHACAFVIQFRMNKTGDNLTIQQLDLLSYPKSYKSSYISWGHV